ncbi:MAG: polysaccharide deacetylase family protein [Clostridia bacterium]|nr:polysaccharide deacetylase family protein [Clostridia bacterium]
MKNKIISVIVNIVLCAVIASVCAVGFVGGEAAQVTSNGDNLYYKSDNPRGVSLMFNVYQNTDNVYAIMDLLDGADAKATFFLGGSWADDNIDCVRDIASRGHEIASHGYFHKDHSKMNYEQNLAEIRPSVKLLNAMLGYDIALFAPPSGAFNDATVTAATSLNLKTIMWSRDTIDWRDSDVSLICKRATNGLENGEFILMHPMDVTVKALPQILDYIRENGLSAVTVSYNLGE